MTIMNLRQVFILAIFSMTLENLVKSETNQTNSKTAKVSQKTYDSSTPNIQIETIVNYSTVCSVSISSKCNLYYLEYFLNYRTISRFPTLTSLEFIAFLSSFQDQMSMNTFKLVQMILEPLKDWTTTYTTLEIQLNFLAMLSR